MSSSIPVIKFMFREDLKVFNDALDIQPRYEVEDVSSANELATYFSTTSAGLVIASLKDKNDLIQIATFLKMSKKMAKDTVVKLAVINFRSDKEYEKAVTNLGILDLIDPRVNTRALKFKIDFLMKSLSVQIRNNASAAGQKTIKAHEGLKASEQKNENNPTLSWLEPLDLENDVWIIKYENDCKKVLSNWHIRLVGPSPYAGQWVEVKASLWRFDFKENEKELFISGNGSWFYEGEQRPEFIWKENNWLITGENFDLYFKDENQIVSRLKSKDKNLTVCKDSLFAKNKESLIVESFDKELIFKREAEQLVDLNGKNKTEKLNTGPLSGKGESADKINGNLSGETKREQAIKNENHVQKTETEKKSTYWNGKNTNTPDVDGAFPDPESGVPCTRPAQERDRSDLDHQNFYKNEDDLGRKGESLTDKLDGHNKSKKEEDADAHDEFFGKGKVRTEATVKEKPDHKPIVEQAVDNTNVLQAKTKEDKKPKTAEEIEIDELTREAKVLSYLTQNDMRFTCQLDDFYDEMIIFKTSEGGINASIQVSLDLTFQYMEKDTRLLMQGDVMNVENDGETSSLVTVKVDPDSASSFDIFMRLYEKRQLNVNEFLKKVKGL